jgi:hypothetical protein
VLYAVGDQVAEGAELLKMQSVSRLIPTHVTLVEVGPRDGLQNEKPARSAPRTRWS